MLHFCPGSDRPDEFQDCGGSGVQKPHPHQDQPSRAVSWRVSLQREQTAKEHCLLCSLETQMGKDGLSDGSWIGAGRVIFSSFSVGNAMLTAPRPHPMAGTYSAQCGRSGS